MKNPFFSEFSEFFEKNIKFFYFVRSCCLIFQNSNNIFFLEELIERLRAEIRDKDGIIEEKNEQIKKLQGQ